MKPHRIRPRWGRCISLAELAVMMESGEHLGWHLERPAAQERLVAAGALRPLRHCLRRPPHPRRWSAGPPCWQLRTDDPAGVQAGLAEVLELERDSCPFPEQHLQAEPVGELPFTT